MEHHDDGGRPEQDRQRVLAQLDRMVAAGRVTGEEAARLRAASTAEAFGEAMAAIRARHAGAKLAAAVAAGELSPDEAAEYRRRLHDEGPSRDLRRRITQAARPRGGS